MRILWISNSPWAPSGYGVQTRLHSQMLRALGHEVHIFSNWSSPTEPPTLREDIPIVGSRGFFGITEYATYYLPDLVIFLGDAWVQDRWRFFKGLLDRVDTRFWTYCPVDCTPLSSAEVPMYDLADLCLAMSPHALDLLERAAFDAAALPHAIDVREWPEIPTIKPIHKRVIGMVQANVGTRKLIPLQIEAFANLVQDPDFEDCVLHIHTDISGESSDFGVDLRGLPAYFDVPDKVYTSSPGEIPPNVLYRNFDVLLQCTSGEGFGMPVVEAAACGVGSVVTGNSALQHFPWTLQVQPVVNEFIPDQMAFRSWPDPVKVTEALKTYLSLANNNDKPRYQANAFDYDVSKIQPIWKDLLENYA